MHVVVCCLVYAAILVWFMLLYLCGLYCCACLVYAAVLVWFIQACQFQANMLSTQTQCFLHFQKRWNSLCLVCAFLQLANSY